MSCFLTIASCRFNDVSRQQRCYTMQCINLHPLYSLYSESPLKFKVYARNKLAMKTELVQAAPAAPSSAAVKTVLTEMNIHAIRTCMTYRKSTNIHSIKFHHFRRLYLNLKISSWVTSAYVTWKYKCVCIYDSSMATGDDDNLDLI